MLHQARRAVTGTLFAALYIGPGGLCRKSVSYQVARAGVGEVTAKHAITDVVKSGPEFRNWAKTSKTCKSDRAPSKAITLLNYGIMCRYIVIYIYMYIILYIFFESTFGQALI